MNSYTLSLINEIIHEWHCTISLDAQLLTIIWSDGTECTYDFGGYELTEENLISCRRHLDRFIARREVEDE